MPAKYGLMQAALHGSVTGKAGPSRPMEEKTPNKKRKKFVFALMNKKEKK